MAIKKNYYTLSNINIDLVSDYIAADMSAAGVPKDQILKTRLSVEEALLRMQERFGHSTEVSISFGRRFSRYYIITRLQGKPYNPLRFSESVFEEWNQMLSFSDYQPDYHYSGGMNMIRWSVSVQKSHPAVSFSLSIFLGILLGLLGKYIASNSGTLSMFLDILRPVQEVWIRLLNVLSGPVVFLLLITTVLNMDSITRQGGSTSRYLSRVFRVSMISTLAAVVACIFFLRDVRFEGFRNSASDFANLILELIPEDALSPFASSNVPQLLLIGVVIGSALIVSGKSHGLISRFIHEANGIGILITGWMSNTVPFFLCVLLAYEIMNSNTRIYTGIWQPLLIFIVLCAALIFINTYIIARKEKCDFRLLVKALMDPFIRTLKGVSADNLFNYTLINCRDRLGIDQRFAESALAVGLVLYMPVSAAGTLIFVIYAASMYNVPTTFSWFVTATVVSVAVSLAVPPVPGVGILTYVVMFAQLGIPETALIGAMLYDVFTNLLMSAANQYMLQLDLIQSADGMAMLDKNKLRTVNA